MTRPYGWILTRPVRRIAIDRSRTPMIVCANCGWEWRGRRRMCPACLTRLEVDDAA